MMRTVPLIAAFSVILFLVQLSTSFALYQWVDEKGIVHLTDYPKPSLQQVEEEKVNAAPPELPAKTDPLPGVLPARQPLSIEKKQGEPTQPAPVPAIPAPKSALVDKPTVSSPQAPLKQTSQDIASSPVRTAQAVQLSLTPLSSDIPKPEQSAAGQTSMPPQQALAAFMAAFAFFILAASVFLYIYGSLCMFLIAGKLNVDAAWTAWVPIINIWTFLASAGKPCWWVLLFFVPFVNFFVGVYLWMCITENLGRSKAQGLIMLLPGVNLIFLGVLAFSRKA